MCILSYRVSAGDYWTALSLYEEAADLGVYAAQENAAYLLEKIMPAECAQYEEYLLKEGNAGEFACCVAFC